MNKNEIIESLAYADLAGETLVEHSDSATGLRVAHIGAHNVRGLRVAAARLFAEQLTADTADLADAPDAKLLERLHAASRDCHQMQINALTILELESELIEDHRKVVERLQKIARELGINYQKPEDPLLADPQA